MIHNDGFTLVEVAIAGSLIGLCVLTAVSIIPRGLQIQNLGRMRAVAAAAVATIAADSFGRNTITQTTYMDISPVAASSIKFLGSRAGVPPATGSLYCVKNIAANSGRLERRIVFSKTSGSTATEINAWLLIKDPGNSPESAEYLATFAESP